MSFQIYAGKTPATGSTGFLEAMRKYLTSCFVQVYPVHIASRDSDDNHIIISGGDGAKDACKGDSGGPLVVKVSKYF